ncbi:MAG: NAD(P)H-hydrate dehydratase [Clostridiales bacterium]|nr:NAD(P)H-hydrate dehydratase [Clostridiales bacterium]
MKRILTGVQMKECDVAQIHAGTPSYVLMERAAKSVVDEIYRNEWETKQTLVVCGNGNNGGDGLIAARLLHMDGIAVHVYFAGDMALCTPETRQAYTDARESGVSFIQSPIWSSYGLIIDALLGIGLSRAPEGSYSEIIQQMNRSGAKILAVDIPSGICADTGETPGAAVCADVTVTMAAYKRGHVIGKGVNHSGRVSCADIGISTDLFDITGNAPSLAYVIEERELSLIPRRKRDANKGTFGRVLVIGGSRGMCGAAYLCAKAAYRSGAGLVEIFTCEENRQPLQILLPEAIVTAYTGDIPDSALLTAALGRASFVVIGPGLGQNDGAEFLVRETLQRTRVPVVCDADALNICASHSLVYPNDIPVIVTPHPGEFSRMTGQSIEALSQDPQNNAVQYARENGVICVLKFARTVITDGSVLFINMSGGPVLSKGGSGDVLCGVISGMLCSGMSPIGAACLGTYIHGRAGDAARAAYGEYSPLASEICDEIAGVLKNAY